MLLEQEKNWVPSSKAEKEAVLQQLERLLGNAHFHKSKRFPDFLRFVVTETLAGRSEALKERTLGIEVFGKDANYDTTEDSIVRVTAGEIRKRIAQYYQEPGHEKEIKFILPLGAYVPQFYPPEMATSALKDAHLPELKQLSAVEAPIPRNSIKLYGGLAIAIALIAVAISVGRYYRPTPIDEFWTPFFQSPDPILFCVADQNQFSTIVLRDASDPKHEKTLNDHMVAVIIDDIGPLVNIAGMLNSHGRTFRVQGESATTFSDLRQAPAVFIGAFDNGWTLRLTSPLRFHFANSPDMHQFWIEDRQHPENKEWVLDRSQQDTGTYKDYALVVRALDPNTGHFAVVVAGLARGGTIASGEFLVDPRHMDELARAAPGDWSRKSMEVVLETQVIDGRSGPPRIKAVHLW